jgi:hypothetical protein
MLCRTSGARVHLCAAVPALWAGLSSAAPTALDVAQRRQELYGTRSFETNTWRLREFGMRIRFFSWHFREKQISRFVRDDA